MSERIGGVVMRKRAGKRVPAVKVPVERPDGTPDYKWVYTDPATGQAFTSKKAAKTEWARLRHHIESGGDPFPDKMTVRAFFERWLDHKRAEGLRSRTLERYAICWRPMCCRKSAGWRCTRFVQPMANASSTGSRSGGSLHGPSCRRAPLCVVASVRLSHGA